MEISTVYSFNDPGHASESVFFCTDNSAATELKCIGQCIHT